jgi:hypothetical protein
MVLALTVLTATGNSCDPSVPDPSITVEQPDNNTLIIRGCGAHKLTSRTAKRAEDLDLNR